MTLNKAFALRITEILIKRNMSKYRLEKLSGLSHSALRHIFNENNNDVKLSTVAKVANAFGLTLHEFFDSDVFGLNKIDFEL